MTAARSSSSTPAATTSATEQASNLVITLLKKYQDLVSEPLKRVEATHRAKTPEETKKLLDSFQEDGIKNQKKLLEKLKEEKQLPEDLLKLLKAAKEESGSLLDCLRTIFMGELVYRDIPPPSYFFFDALFIMTPRDIAVKYSDIFQDINKFYNPRANRYEPSSGPSRSRDRTAILPPLHIAVKEGNVDTVRNLLNSKANVNELDDNQETPLNHAARSSSWKAMIPLLLETKADIDAPTSVNKGTVLINFWGNSELCKFLLGAKANPTILTGYGTNPYLQDIKNLQNMVHRMGQGETPNAEEFNRISTRVIMATTHISTTLRK